MEFCGSLISPGKFVDFPPNLLYIAITDGECAQELVKGKERLMQHANVVISKTKLKPDNFLT